MALIRRRPARERGATLVEYAVILSVLVLAVTGGARALNAASSDELDERAGSINHVGPAKEYEPIPLPTVPTTTSTTAPMSTTSTTAPPVSTTTTTTTTTPTTTTTTTTTPPPANSPVKITEVSASGQWWHGGGQWVASATFQYSAPNGGNLDVQVTRHYRDGSTDQHRNQSLWVSGTQTIGYLPGNNHSFSSNPASDVVSVEITVLGHRPNGGSYQSLTGVSAHLPAPTN